MYDLIRVGFAGLAVDLALKDDHAGRLARFVFGRFAAAPAGVACLRLELAGNGPEHFTLWREGSLVFEATCAADAARLVLAEVIHAFASQCTTIPLLHAAAIGNSAASVLLPGASGAGKSTLCAAMDAAGHACLSDELVGVAGGRAVLAFPRPICLKPDARQVLPGITDSAAVSGRLLQSADAVVLSPQTPLPVPLPRLCAIVFASFTPGAPPALHANTRGETAARLMGSVANARQLSDHGFAAIAALARLVPGYTLVHGSAGDGAQAIGAIIRTAGQPGAWPRTINPPAGR